MERKGSGIPGRKEAEGSTSSTLGSTGKDKESTSSKYLIHSRNALARTRKVLEGPHPLQEILARTRKVLHNVISGNKAESTYVNFPHWV